VSYSPVGWDCFAWRQRISSLIVPESALVKRRVASFTVAANNGRYDPSTRSIQLW
jgi:hypothetical protein